MKKHKNMKQLKYREKIVRYTLCLPESVANSVAELALKEERSVPKMAALLVKRGLQDSSYAQN